MAQRALKFVCHVERESSGRGSGFRWKWMHARTGACCLSESSERPTRETGTAADVSLATCVDGSVGTRYGPMDLRCIESSRSTQALVRAAW